MIFDALFFTANRTFPVQQHGVQNVVDVKIYTFLTQWEFSICAMVSFLDKGFLLATSGRKIKSHVVESQITSLVLPWLSLTEKQQFNFQSLTRSNQNQIPMSRFTRFFDKSFFLKKKSEIWPKYGQLTLSLYFLDRIGVH